MLLAALAAVLIAQPHEAVSRERLMATLRELPVKRAALGDAAHRAGLAQTEALVEAKVRELGYEPRLEAFRWALPMQPAPEGEPAKTPEPHTWHNVIVERRGTDLAHEVLVLSAHFDAVPNCPGADDDGTGTAGLLEIARVVKDHPTRRTIRFCFFNLEEVGLIGSSRHVMSMPGRAKDAPAEATDRVIGMASLEMLGFFSDAPDSQKSPIKAVPGVFEPPTVGDSIVVSGLARDAVFIRRLSDEMLKAAPGLKVTRVDFLPIPVPDMMRSDHRPFVLAGMPGVMVTDTANFRNPNYHKPTDTVETIDAERFALVVRALAGAAYAIAEPAAEPAR